MRLIFAGTPEFAATALQALLDSEHDVCAVYTQPDRPAGRGKKTTASAVKQLALAHEIPVEQPIDFKNTADCDTLNSYQADVMVVVAYGLLLPQAVLDMPTYGCLNIHGSLLPRWRGAAPIQRAILAGDTESGVCIMQMEAGLDTGPVLLEKRCQITATDTAQTLHDRLAEMGATAIVESLDNLAALRSAAQRQNDTDSCYARKLSKAEAAIDWQQSAVEIGRLIRAFNAWPVAHTNWQNTRMRIWQAQALPTTSTAAVGEVVALTDHQIHVATGEGILAIESLQLPGKRAISAADFINGHTDLIGVSLG